MMLAADSRSQKGCWTCRARRKKCDERPQPTCYTCESLQLNCHGYGPRPDWMDGGCREKAQIMEFKDAVKRSSKFRKRSRTLNNMNSDEKTPISTEQSNSISDHGSALDNSLQELNCRSSLGPVCTAGQYPYALFPAMPPDSFFGNVDLETPEHKLLHDPFSYSLREFHSPYNVFWGTDRNQASMDPLGFLDEFPRPETDYPMGHVSSSPVSSGSTPISIASRSSSGKIPSSSRTVIFSEQLRRLPVEELSAIRFYFENIVSEQFQFLDASTMQEFRPQLLELAGNSKICLLAIISQGINGQRTELSKLALDSNTCLGTSAEAYEASALQGLYESLDNYDRSKRNILDPSDEFRFVEEMVCIALIILSMINRKDDAWARLVQIAASFNPINFDKLRDQSLRSLWGFQTMLICIDVLTCVTTSSEPRFALKFGDELKDDPSTRCDEVIGCDSSVMASIMNIGELQHWKNQETDSMSISVIELARRALKIELQLQEARRRNFEHIKNHSILMSSVKDSWIITNLFACAASVYLHAAVSGCSPEVPEIKIGVADTIDAIKLLPRLGLVKRLMWPVCIAACLAEGVHRDFFEQFEHTLAEELGTSQNILRALRTGKECWKLRRDSPSRKMSYECTDAMASLEDLVPLIF